MALTKITGEGVGAVDSIGIGTSSPLASLQVADATNELDGTMRFGNNATYYGYIQKVYSTDKFIIGTNGSGQNLVFENGGAERMRIDSSGSVMIGTTSVTSTSNKAGISFIDDNVNARTIVRTACNSTASTTLVDFINANGYVGSIVTSGSATAYNTSSDHRLKENVTADWDATTRLKQLNPVRFNFIVDADTTVDGFLAHEVQDIVPEAISGTKDAVDDEGNPVYQGIDQSKLVPLLVKTIQELEARITALETA